MVATQMVGDSASERTISDLKTLLNNAVKKTVRDGTHRLNDLIQKRGSPCDAERSWGRRALVDKSRMTIGGHLPLHQLDEAHRVQPARQWWHRVRVHLRCSLGC